MGAMKLIFLCTMVFLAGFIDSIAGGGGLISLNSYNVAGVTGQTSLGTNKFSAFFGSVIACINYIRSGNYHLMSVVPSFIGALIGSAYGSYMVLSLDKGMFSILMLVTTPIVAAVTFFKKDYSDDGVRKMTDRMYVILGLLIGLVIGFYDGFYGPGTGTLMQIAFIQLCHLEAKKAAGNARLVNTASGIAAMITFMITGHVIYSLAIPCGICSIVGNFIGSRLAIKKDVKIIRPMMLIVVSLLFAVILLDFLGITA